MSRPPKDPLRSLNKDEKNELERISRSSSLPAIQVNRAKLVLAVAEGMNYTAAARSIGRRSNDAVSNLVSRFNQEGLEALIPRHGGGPQPRYGEQEKARILEEVERKPDREKDGSATWSLSLLRNALRKAPDGLPDVSIDTVQKTLHEAGWSWQRSRSWCNTGTVLRKRQGEMVEIIDPETEPKKLIERAYRMGKTLGLPVWVEDEAGPYRTEPYQGSSWQPEEHPAHQSHEYHPNGIVKMLTLFHPKTGELRVKGIRSCTNAVLHPWLKKELSEILAQLPEPSQEIGPEENRILWESWQAGLTKRIPLPEHLPPLRCLLVWDNLQGHKSVTMVEWLVAHGIMLLYTPLGGSWLNMAESIQRIIQRRALEGCHPTQPEQIIEWLEATARGWNADPTPFEWSGKRKARRQRAHARRHRLGGSGACTTQPVPRVSYASF